MLQNKKIDKEILINLSKTKRQITENLEVYYVKLGSVLGEALCEPKHNFMHKAQKKINKVRYQVVLQLTEQLEMHLTLTASYYISYYSELDWLIRP
jgi:hypothetical protein